MSDREPIPTSAVVPHVFYKALSWDEEAALTDADDSAGTLRQLLRLELKPGADKPDAVLVYPRAELPPWPYCVRLHRLFSPDARSAIESRLLEDDRIAFASFPVRLLNGTTDEAHLATPTDLIDVLSPHSEVGPLGVARRWGLELSKLRRRSFFGVPEAPGTTIARGETLLALAALGSGFFIYEATVFDGDRRVDYAEWAEHPEWTTP